MEIDDDFLTGACRNKDRGADRLEEVELVTHGTSEFRVEKGDGCK